MGVKLTRVMGEGGGRQRTWEVKDTMASLRGQMLFCINQLLPSRNQSPKLPDSLSFKMAELLFIM